jgi:hypothetical protein
MRRISRIDGLSARLNGIAALLQGQRSYRVGDWLLKELAPRFAANFG